jgi:hypothetical protein
VSTASCKMLDIFERKAFRIIRVFSSIFFLRVLYGLDRS